MTRIPIDDTYSLGIEPYDKRLRLIIFKGKEEYVCRKETFKNMKEFFQSDLKHIFKGRLQLQKKGTSLEVIVKKEVIGKVKAKDLEKSIEAL